MCFKIPSPWENYGLQHWWKAWIQLDDIKCLQISFPCQPTLPKSPCLGLFTSPIAFIRQRLCQACLAHSALGHLSSLPPPKKCSSSRDKQTKKKNQKSGSKTSLFKGQVLLTEAVRAVASRVEFYVSKLWSGDVHAHDMRASCIFCPQNTTKNTEVCSQDQTSDTGERF